MREFFHRHTQKIFQTDIGICLALLAVAVWAFDLYLRKQSIGFEGIITLLGFLALFFVERGHGREVKAINLKLDELIAALPGASNRLIKVEEAPETSVQLAHEALQKLVAEHEPHDSISLEHTKFFEQNDLGPLE